MSYRLRNDEVATGATFIKSRFSNDRKEIEEVFEEFDQDFQDDFDNQIEVVKKLDRKYAKTQQQVEASNRLYLCASETNTEMNRLSFKYKSAGLETTLITTVKVKLKKLDIEGAHENIKDLAEFTKDNIALLASKGVKPEYPTSLLNTADKLLGLNEKQNILIDQSQKLTKANEKEYNKLRKTIAHILKAGKIVFENDDRRDFYLMSKLIARMRSGNGGNKE